MKILLAIDGSSHALQAVRQALHWVDEGLRADFVLVNVQEPASLYEVVTAHDAELIDRVRGAAGADLLKAAEELLDEAEVGYESEVAGGVPEHLIVEVAENYGCDHIVMGALGTGHAEGHALGRVAQAVLQGSPMPVTVVRAGEAAAGEAAGDDDADMA